MQDATSQQYGAFREEVRRFIEQNLTDEMREAGRLQTGFPNVEQSIAWQKVRHRACCGPGRAEIPARRRCRAVYTD
jgi:hypothetical protein